MKLTRLRILLMVVVTSQLIGCAGFRFSSTESKARDRYLFIESNEASFGNKRFAAFLDYHHGMEGFVASHGTPDFFYECKNEKSRQSVRLYYIEENRVYIYESLSWRPSSMFLKEQRPLTDYEFAAYRELNPQHGMIL